MTSYVPQPPQVLAAFANKAFAEAEAAAAPSTPACVDCAVDGVTSPLSAVYTVSGTVLCVEHAVLARTNQTVGADK